MNTKTEMIHLGIGSSKEYNLTYMYMPRMDARDSFWNHYEICFDTNSPSRFLFQKMGRFFARVTKKKIINFFFVTLDFQSKPTIHIYVDISAPFRKRVTKKIEEHLADLLSGLENSYFLNDNKFNFTYPNACGNWHNFYNGQAISNSILRYFRNKEMCEDSMLTLSIILHLIWIKSRCLINDERVSDVLTRGYGWFFNDILASKNQLAMYDRLFAHNKIYLMSLHHQIWKKNNMSSWMREFEHTCCGMLTSNKNFFLINASLNELTFYYVPDLINKQLGVNEQKKWIQTYIINRIFDKLSEY